MSGCRRCETASSGGGDTRPATLARRGLDVAGWVIPGATLALLPKCPACLAAYVAIGTGISLTMSTATYLRTMMMIACVASLAYVAARSARRWFGLVFTTNGTVR
jgi:hypothetical protein